MSKSGHPVSDLSALHPKAPAGEIPAGPPSRCCIGAATARAAAFHGNPRSRESALVARDSRARQAFNHKSLPSLAPLPTVIGYLGGTRPAHVKMSIRLGKQLSRRGKHDSLGGSEMLKGLPV